MNLSILPAINAPDYDSYARVIIEEGIRIVETAGNNPVAVVQQLKDSSIIVIHKCTSVRHALSAAKMGVDFVSIDGFECAGHVGESDVTNMVLLNKARTQLHIPYIASGGFADGYGLAAALCLGAQGVNMGTRFMATIDAPIHYNVKKAIVDAEETDTILVLRKWRNTMRLYKNRIASEAMRVEIENTSGKFDELAPLVTGKRAKEVFANGDTEYGVWSIGQVAGLIYDIPTCRELLARMEREAITVLTQANVAFTPKAHV